MTAATHDAAPAPPANPPLQLHCMEIWGGNEATDTALSVPGLDVWVSSTPYAGDAQGGDIHYLSMCGSGRITRFALADVAGHGDVVADLAAALRRLMRKHINTLDQTRFARDLNREFAELSASGRFATALLTTYFAPTDQLILVNAGHPRPLWYDASAGQWHVLDEAQRDELDSGAEQADEADARYWGKPVSNLPLGVIEPTEYVQFAVKLGPHDLVLAYTDSLVEARDPHGAMLGEAGLLAMVQTLDATRPATLAPALQLALTDYRGGQPPDDDQTLLLLHHNATEPPPLSMGQAVKSLAKMVGLLPV